MSNFLDHAIRELDLIGMTEDADDEMNRAMRKHILHMIDEFSKEGHSGYSARYAINILTKLMNYDPLTPLTGEDDEWEEVSEGVYQNKRFSRVFKQADRFNGQAYDVNGIVLRNKDGSCWTSVESHVPIEFPYTPTTRYVDREDLFDSEDDEESTDG